MMDCVPIGKQAMDPQALSTFSHGQRHSSDIEYEIAHQLIQHSQGRGDSKDYDSSTSASELRPRRSPSPNGVPHIDQFIVNSKPLPDADSRRSPSQDRMSESQYAPLSNPPAMGQVCREADNFKQLSNHADPVMATITYRINDLQCLRTIPESKEYAPSYNY
ncbi:MAG: hypothetical protein L6R40_007929 [Gallowayella cf. fulva]|nr:MAG: hypothetical protein L6R40_007929 [Xanthomendoza cf. fulva]